MTDPRLKRTITRPIVCYITGFDAQLTYHEIPIKEASDVSETTVLTAKGKYGFKGLPFGVSSSPWLFAPALWTPPSLVLAHGVASHAHG